MKEINNSKIDKIKYYLLISFIVIQPLLDTYYLYTDKVVNMFGFSPSTIIRVGITFVLVLLTLWTLRNKKSWMFIIGYCVLVAIYGIAHLMNANQFQSVVPGNFGYSLVSELLYLVRLMIPLCILFITFNTKISVKDFENAIKIILILIAGTIVITNIFKVSMNSYTNEIIKDNIFGWFTGAYDVYNYSSLASKGIFNFANQIAALLVLLLPIMLVIYIRTNTISNLVTILLTVTAMVMLGTKVALFGAVIDVFVFIAAIAFIRVFKKENLMTYQNYIMLGTVMMLLGVLFTKAPALNRELVSHYVRENNSKVEIIGVEDASDKKDEETKDKKDEETKENEPIVEEHIVIQPDKNDKSSMIEYIEKNYKNLMVGEHFITKSYPYQYDPEFWVDIVNLPVYERLNWRNIEQKMLQRVMDINDNPMDKYLGLTFTRTQNIYNLERDFISQYYSIGILGVLLFIGPYVLISLFCLAMIFIKFKERFTLFNSISCFAVLFALGVSYYSGNVLDSLTVTIILTFILGQILNTVLDKNYIGKVDTND